MVLVLDLGYELLLVFESVSLLALVSVLLMKMVLKMVLMWGLMFVLG